MTYDTDTYKTPLASKKNLVTSGEAAKIARVSRQTIDRWLKDRKLSISEIDSNGTRFIDRSELQRVIDDKKLSGDLNDSYTRNDSDSNIKEKIELAKLQVEVSYLKEQNKELQKDRDHWRDSHKQVTLLLSSKQFSSENPQSQPVTDTVTTKPSEPIILGDNSQKNEPAKVESIKTENIGDQRTPEKKSGILAGIAKIFGGNYRPRR